eukprot:TRINITY_DN79186_c0_g1_i1.p1 TRINITY_DN79186_c0_g1~~TRINITY_DN79186_c0_g1_i1.p1  ORF type:complete len:377 (+),score=62.18 TRINITY_DN79186_c0_g1_i1:902-2032(+)
MYGGEIRAWRRGLDPKSTFIVSLSSLKAWFCNQPELREIIDLPLLWRSLDRDDCGSIFMEELAPKASETLATFRQWASEQLGSCTAVWDHPIVRQALKGSKSDSWKSESKLLLGAFAKALKKLGCPQIADIDARSRLLAALDYFGCGFISQSDLKWLDSWESPEWLHSAPSPEAWALARSLIMKRFDHPLKAWRNLLDRDDSNSVSWREFKSACSTVGFKGNLGGAWRALDDDLSGSVSLREFDEPSAAILESFKAWGEANFGSVELLFKAIDADGSGSVSFPELKRACAKGKWSGDVLLLFNCLDFEGEGTGRKRTLDMEEVIFLDSWQPVEDEHAQSCLNSPNGMSRAVTAESSVNDSSKLLRSQSCTSSHMCP